MLPRKLSIQVAFNRLVCRPAPPSHTSVFPNWYSNLGDTGHSALIGGDCIDDADALRAGTAGVLDCLVKAPSTLGTFLRSFRWGHVRQLDRVSRELLPLFSRAWAAGAGPMRRTPIDLIPPCETYGPWLHRQAGLSPHCWPSPPAPETCSWACARAAPTACPLPIQGPTHAGRQRLLHRGIRLPQDGCPLLQPSASTKAYVIEVL